MDERRKSKRLELNSKLILKRLDNEKQEEIGIEVDDLSKTGVGFRCEMPLTIGAVYEGFLTIWTKEVIHALIEIVRIEKTPDGYVYGASFVGMPDMDSGRIEIYQTVQDNIK
ncbi:MAG: PilZ domain-containing protein [Clostridiales bacterium]|nr:PilZ domain-containing protein [Clostridiales bacterium]